MPVLVEHFAAVEAALLAQASVQANAGHSQHKGTPREHFIREFLNGHVSERIAIGTGEVVSADSEGESRNQHDIIAYKRDFPRLVLGGGINAFLVESVVATIEVKSTLTKDELARAFMAARRLKELPRSITCSFYAGFQPPSILSYVVAYDGPANMGTVYDWLPDIHRDLGIGAAVLGPNRLERSKVSAPALDGIFVLGKGMVTFDNTPISILSDEVCSQRQDVAWVSVDIARGSLLFLFTFLTSAVSGVSASWLNPGPYLNGLSIPKASIQGGPGV